MTARHPTERTRRSSMRSGPVFAAVTYLVITALSLTTIAILHAAGALTPDQLITGYILTPATAALLSWAIAGARPRFGPFRVWPILAGAGIPLGVGIGYLVGSWLGVFTNTHETWIVLLAVFPQTVLGAAMEEIGWRGLLLPQLRRRLDFLSANSIVAVVWFLFHFPMILFGFYGDLPHASWFMVNLAMFSFLIGIVWEYGGGVAMATLSHALWNLVMTILSVAFIEKIPDSIGEFSWFLTLPLVVMLAVGLVILRVNPPLKPVWPDLETAHRPRGL